MSRRPRPRTVALPMIVTVIALVSLTALLTHSDEAIIVTITGSSVTTNPPGSFGPRTFTVSGTVRSRGAIYKQYNGIMVVLVRKDERSGLVESLPQMDMQGTGAEEVRPEDGSGSFTMSTTPKLRVDESNLFLRVRPLDTAGHSLDPFDVPVRQD